MCLRLAKTRLAHFQPGYLRQKAEKIGCMNSVASTASCCAQSALEISGTGKKSLPLTNRTHWSFSLVLARPGFYMQ